MKEEVKQCCAVCEYIYDKEKCPLYYVYKDSEYNGILKPKGQYKMVCDEFEVNSKLVDTPDIPKESDISIEKEIILRKTIKNILYTYVEDVKREYDTPESLDYWTQEIMKNIKL